MSRNPNPVHPIRALIDEYNVLREGDGNRQIARVILRHIRDVPKLTLAKAAEVCHVSASTFSRFCHDLGYSSYSDFKYQITNDLDNYLMQNIGTPKAWSLYANDTVDALIKLLTQDMKIMDETLDKKLLTPAAELLHSADTIFIHDTHYSEIRAMLQADLAFTGKDVVFSPDNISQKKDIEHMNQNAMVIVVNDGYPDSRYVIQGILKSKKKGAKILAISPTSAFANSPLCDIILQTGTDLSRQGRLIADDLIFACLSMEYKRLYISELFSVQIDESKD